jgi:hypothetical protein
MSTHMTRSTTAVAAIALVFVAAACGSSSKQATPKVTAQTTNATTTEAPTTSAPPPTTAKPKAKVTAPATAPPTFPPAIADTVPAPTAPPETVPPETMPLATAPPTTGAPGSIHLVGGVGVSAAQLQRAEALLTVTIADLKRFKTPKQAFDAGYRSIGDAATGDEHYTNWSYDNDGHILDPKRPESVVYEWVNGKQTAVAAMYSLPIGSSFADVPDVGGALTQWHVHSDLCLTKDKDHRVVSGIVGVNGTCPAGTSKAGNTPMLHVWVIPNPCGPFAALEGIGAGQVPPGQTRNCDTSNALVP